MSSDAHQNESPASASPVDVAEEFVREYYETLFTKQNDIQTLYKEDSVFTSVTENVSESLNERVVGQNIGGALRALSLDGYRVRLPVFQAQESIYGCILILAKGRFFKKGESVERPFAQTFLLAPNSEEESWYVKNDILIFLSSEVSDAHSNNAATPASQSNQATNSAKTEQPAQSQPAQPSGGIISGLASMVSNAATSVVASLSAAPAAEASSPATASPAPAQSEQTASKPSESQSSQQSSSSHSSSQSIQNLSQNQNQSQNNQNNQNQAQASSNDQPRRDSPMPNNNRRTNSGSQQQQQSSGSSSSGFSSRPSYTKGKEKEDDSTIPPHIKSYASVVGAGITQAPIVPAEANQAVKSPNAPKKENLILKVGNVPYENQEGTIEKELRTLLEPFGKILDVRMTRGVAYVEYSNTDNVKRAVAEGTGLRIGERDLSLEEKIQRRGVKADGKRVGMGDERRDRAERNRGGRGRGRGGGRGGDRDGDKKEGGRGGNKEQGKEGQSGNDNNNNNNNNASGNQGQGNQGGRGRGYQGSNRGNYQGDREGGNRRGNYQGNRGDRDGGNYQGNRGDRGDQGGNYQGGNRGDRDGGNYQGGNRGDQGNNQGGRNNSERN